ncbi:hypothetical protein [Thermomonospora amylolytica]|uniref:hypothetical protein n=1 Tax=Thermomonospora amylolytica TaxID=1411117 RepID=UPI001300AE80|nr:hypothetical protein [Thermomonospora amylolytica]
MQHQAATPHGGEISELTLDDVSLLDLSDESPLAKVLQDILAEGYVPGGARFDSFMPSD